MRTNLHTKSHVAYVASEHKASSIFANFVGDLARKQVPAAIL